MKYRLTIILSIISLSCLSQPLHIRKIQSDILTAFITSDTNAVKRLVNDEFFMIHGDGSISDKQTFIHSYDKFSSDNALSIMLEHDSHVEMEDLLIVKGTLVLQWMEGDRMLRSKKPYVDHYKYRNGKWTMIASYLNDNSEDYYVISDTTGIRSKLNMQHNLLNASVMEKDVYSFLKLRSFDFKQREYTGKISGPSVMRNRAMNLFNTLRDKVHITNSVETFQITEDTVKVIVLQNFRRNQMIRGKLQSVESSVRQRESWMNTRAGWKLVYIDSIKPMALKVDNLNTDLHLLSDFIE